MLLLPVGAARLGPRRLPSGPFTGRPPLLAQHEQGNHCQDLKVDITPHSSGSVLQGSECTACRLRATHHLLGLVSPCRIFSYFLIFPKSGGFQNVTLSWDFLNQKVSESIFLAPKHSPNSGDSHLVILNTYVQF